MNTLDRNTVIAENWPLIRWAGLRASRITRGRLSPEDGVSAVALAVVKRWDRYDPARGSLGTWITWVARNVAHQFLAYIRRPGRDENRERDGLDFARIAAPEPESHDLPHELAVHLPKLLAAVADLPADQRTAITLRYGLDGGGYRTLDQLDPTVTREANRMRVRSAIERLRAELIPTSMATVDTLPRDTAAADGQRLLAVLRSYRCPLTARTLTRLTGLDGTPFRRAVNVLREAGLIRRRGRGYKLVRRKAVAA